MEVGRRKLYFWNHRTDFRRAVDVHWSHSSPLPSVLAYFKYNIVHFSFRKKREVDLFELQHKEPEIFKGSLVSITMLFFKVAATHFRLHDAYKITKRKIRMVFVCVYVFLASFFQSFILFTSSPPFSFQTYLQRFLLFRIIVIRASTQKNRLKIIRLRKLGKNFSKKQLKIDWKLSNFF